MSNRLESCRSKLSELRERFVSGIEDVKQLNTNGIPAVVIGKAFYEGRIRMDELGV